MATPSNFAVPPDRPHFAVWPRRLPRAVVAPETSLWFNLEVVATRYPDRAAYLFFGRALTFRQLRDDAVALAGWLQRAGVAKGDRVVLFMQNCPQFATALYAILRANAVVVPVNPMNRAEELKHYINDPGTKVVICTADLAAIIAKANDAVARARACPRHDRHPLHRRDAGRRRSPRPTRRRRRWMLGCAPIPSLPPGCSRWSDALADAARARPAHGAARRSGAAALHLGHHRPAQGLHAHPPQLMHNTVCGQWGNGAARDGRARRRADVPHHRHGLQRHARCYSGATLVLMPRWDRELAGRLISRSGVTPLDLHPDHGDRPVGQPELRPVRPVEPAQHQRRRRGDAVRGGAAAANEFGLRFVEGYGLTETAAPSHTNPPERAKLQCLGIPILSVDSRVVDPVTLVELPPGEVGEIIIRGPMVFTGYWKQPEATAAAFIEFDGQQLLPHRRPRPRWTRTATSSSPIASSG